MADLAAPLLEVDLQRLGTTLALEVRGDVDVASADELRHHVSQALRERPAMVVVDLRHVDFVDSAGVHLLLDARNEAEARCVSLVVLRPERGAARVFDVCGVTSLLPRTEPPRFVTEWSR